MERKYFILANMITIMFVLGMVIPAFGDGFSMENLPPATLGNRQATLFIQVNPPILTTESIKNAFIFLRLYDANTNQTIKHVSYFIKVEKGGTMLMQDLFHTHTGEMRLKIDPKEGPVHIDGDQEPILNAWVESGGPIVVHGPIFLEGGLYHFSMEIFGVDYDNNIFKPEDAPKFDAWLSVGDVSDNSITYQDKKYNMGIISYYDRIKDFSFDPKTRQISFSMPFNYDIPRLQKNPIFVHEEVRVPTNFTDFVESGNFEGTVNGNALGGRTLIVDPYSFEDRIVIHLLINKQDILNLANQVGNSTVPQDMKFTLKPAEMMQPSAGNSMNLVTDNNKIRVLVKSNITSIEPGKPVNFGITFFDANTNTLLRNAHYDFKIFDSNGNAILNKENNFTNEGIDTQTFTFENTGAMTVQVRITGVGQPGIKLDTSYAGTAQGLISVVPEFPLSIAMVMAFVFGIMTLVSYRYGKLLR